MRFAASLRNWGAGVAAVSFLCAGAAWAQPHASTQKQDTMQRSWNLVGVNAQLQQQLDAKTAHRGEVVRARLNGAVKTANGMRLDRGTELWGKVDQVQASSNGGPSMLSIVFTKARMKDGKTIPVKVTVIGAYPASEAQMAVDGDETMPPAPEHINNKERIDQEAGTIGHVSMHSAVQSRDSATFRDAQGNLKLANGTFLQLGIARANSASRQG
jgi:hypothetical protein